MQIERGIPFPRNPEIAARRRATVAPDVAASFKYPFHDMVVGDCFFVDTPQDRQRALVQAAKFAFTRAAGGNGARRFASMKAPAGFGQDGRIGIWRVE